MSDYYGRPVHSQSVSIGDTVRHLATHQAGLVICIFEVGGRTWITVHCTDDGSTCNWCLESCVTAF